MTAYHKCQRCEARSTVGPLAGGLEYCELCTPLAPHDALLMSVRASLDVRGVPRETADAIVAGVRATLPGTIPAPSPAGADLEALSRVGARAWERWVSDADPSPEGRRRLEALRPYRHQVVRVILEALAHDAGLVWT